MEGLFVPVTEAAKRLGVNNATIQRAFDKGTLKGIKTPGGWRRIYTSEIERILKGNENANNINRDE